MIVVFTCVVSVYDRHGNGGELNRDDQKIQMNGHSDFNYNYIICLQYTTLFKTKTGTDPD